jgi:hypothetical protein
MAAESREAALGHGARSITTNHEKGGSVTTLKLEPLPMIERSTSRKYMFSHIPFSSAMSCYELRMLLFLDNFLTRIFAKPQFRDFDKTAVTLDYVGRSVFFVVGASPPPHPTP